VSCLPGVGSTARNELARLNVRTVADLRALPPAYLASAFGEARGRLIHDLARGLDTRPAPSPHPPRSVSRETTFASDTTDPAVVASMLHYLVERAGLRLRRLGLAAARLEVRVRYADGRGQAASAPLSPPAFFDGEIYAAARPLLAALLAPRAGVRHVGATLSRLGPPARQIDFLAAPQAEKAEARARGVDRVREILGFNAVTVGASIELLGRIEKESTHEGGFRLNSPALTQ
jgi:DNA polymerase-4